MQLLEDHIRREGKVAPGNVLRVDGFLNHQIDVVLLTKLAEEFHTRFSGEKVDKILTIEASGIAIGCLVAQQFGVPLVFAKNPALPICPLMFTPPRCTPIPTAMSIRSWYPGSICTAVSVSSSLMTF